MKHNTKKLVLSGLFLAIGLVLPFLTGQTPKSAIDQPDALSRPVVRLPLRRSLRLLWWD